MRKNIEQSDSTDYEYMKRTVSEKELALVQTGYECFGWQPDAQFAVPQKNADYITVYLKRDKKLLNRTELTRLQHNFEACLEEIGVLQSSVTHMARGISVIVGVVGLALSVGAILAASVSPPLFGLSIVLGAFGIAGLVSPIFFYRKVLRHRKQTAAPLIEEKKKEMNTVMERGRALLS